MKLADFRIPRRLDEAQAILRELGAGGFPLAGATSLGFMPGKDPKTAVDILRLGLGGIRRENGLFLIGATTRVAEIQKHHEPGWVLDGVAVRLATQPIRNMSTLGGNIARVFPWADFPVALLALGAQVVVTGDTARAVPADEFFASQPAARLQHGELVTEIRLRPLGAGEGFGYRKEVLTAADFSRATAAVWIRAEGSSIAEARVALGAAVAFPARLPDVEAALRGRRLAEKPETLVPGAALEQLKIRAAQGESADYAAQQALVALRDAVAEACAREGRRVEAASRRFSGAAGVGRSRGDNV